MRKTRRKTLLCVSYCLAEEKGEVPPLKSNNTSFPMRNTLRVAVMAYFTKSTSSAARQRVQYSQNNITKHPDFYVCRYVSFGTCMYMKLANSCAIREFGRNFFNYEQFNFFPYHDKRVQ